MPTVEEFLAALGNPTTFPQLDALYRSLTRVVARIPKGAEDPAPGLSPSFNFWLGIHSAVRITKDRAFVEFFAEYFKNR